MCRTSGFAYINIGQILGIPYRAINLALMERTEFCLVISRQTGRAICIPIKWTRDFNWTRCVERWQLFSVFGIFMLGNLAVNRYVSAIFMSLRLTPDQNNDTKNCSLIRTYYFT